MRTRRSSEVLQSGLAVMLAVVAIVLCLCCLSCGHSKLRAAQSSGKSSGITKKAISRSHPLTLAEMLAEIDAYPAPPNVNRARFEMLRTDLKRRLRELHSGKTVLSAPSEDVDTDYTYLSIDPGGTTATVTWTEKLAGDYNNDGEVGIADLGPVAEYYGTSTDSGPDDAHRLVVGDTYKDGDDISPEINIADLQAIAIHYGERLDGYRVYRGIFNGTSTSWEGTFRPNPTPPNTDWSADRPSPPVSTRPPYTYVDDITGVWMATRYLLVYKVAAYDGNTPEVQTVPYYSSSVKSSWGVPFASVSGTVTDQDSNPMAGVTVTLTPGGQTAVTLANGTYTISNVVAHAYTLTPSWQGYAFDPPYTNVDIAGDDIIGQDFGCLGQGHTVSGTVTLSGNGLTGVTMTLRSTNTTPPLNTYPPLTATTDVNGTYAISAVPDGPYDLTPTRKTPDIESMYAFSPGYMGITVSGSDLTGNAFTATAAVGGLAGAWWPKFRADSKNTGYTIYPGVGAGAEVHSTDFSDPDLGYRPLSSPVVGPDGLTVFVGASTSDYPNGAGAVVALQSSGAGSDLRVKWVQSTSAPVMSSPAVSADGSVYVACENRDIYALFAEDGHVRWVTSLGGTLLLSSSPALGLDGAVYIGTGDGDLYALDQGDGSVRWSYSTLQDESIKSSPTIGADGTIYFGYGGYNGPSNIGKGGVSALQPNGTLKWQYDAGRPVTVSVAIGPDNTIYGGTDGNYDATVCAAGKLFALEPADGTDKWGISPSPLSYEGSFAIVPDPPPSNDVTLLLGTMGINSNVFEALASATHIANWQYPLPSYGGGMFGYFVRSSPAACSTGIVYFGAQDGFLRALSISSGTLLWEYNVGTEIGSSPAIGSSAGVYVCDSTPSAAGKHLYVFWPTSDAAEPNNNLNNAANLDKPGTYYARIGGSDLWDCYEYTPSTDGVLSVSYSYPITDGEAGIYLGPSQNGAMVSAGASGQVKTACQSNVTYYIAFSSVQGNPNLPYSFTVSVVNPSWSDLGEPNGSFGTATVPMLVTNTQYATGASGSDQWDFYKFDQAVSSGTNYDCVVSYDTGRIDFWVFHLDQSTSYGSCVGDPTPKRLQVSATESGFYVKSQAVDTATSHYTICVSPVSKRAPVS